MESYASYTYENLSIKFEGQKQLFCFPKKYFIGGCAMSPAKIIFKNTKQGNDFKGVQNGKFTSNPDILYINLIKTIFVKNLPFLPKNEYFIY